MTTYIFKVMYLREDEMVFANPFGSVLRYPIISGWGEIQTGDRKGDRLRLDFEPDSKVKVNQLFEIRQITPEEDQFKLTDGWVKIKRITQKEFKSDWMGK